MKNTGNQSQIAEVHCKKIISVSLDSFIFLFFNYLIYFNWRLITLQYCSSFVIH